MDNLFFAIWRGSGRKTQRPEDFWLDPPSGGFHRLLLAVAIIGAGAWLLDHGIAGAGKADTLVAASYGSSQYGSLK